MIRAWMLAGLLAAVPGVAQGADKAADQYPVTVIAPSKGPFNFPQGYKIPWEKIDISVTEKIAPNIYILHGSPALDSAHPDAAGGRVAALFGTDGVLMVDTEDQQLADKALKTLRSFTNAPIKIVVNSHEHSDHTGGNAVFAKQGAVIFSQENLREELLHPPARANGQPSPAPDPASIPTATYQYDPAHQGEPAVVIRMDGETVDFIPMPPSHTAGDTIVRFEKANAIYIEDFYRNFGYPFADQVNGGSIKGMLDAVDLIESLADNNTILIPGHGTLVHKKDLLPYREMLVEMLARVKSLRAQGKSLKDVLAMDLTKPYDASTLGDSQDSKDRFVSEVYLEVKDFPPVVDGHRPMPKPPQ